MPRSQRDSHVLRIARLLPVLIGGFELRFLIARLAHLGPELQRTAHAYLHSGAPWLVTLVALGAGVMLREIARGLGTRMSAPQWSQPLLGRWLVCSTVVVVLLGGEALWRDLIVGGHAGGSADLFASAGWASIPAAVVVGFALAVAFDGARWVIHRVRHRPRATAELRRIAVISVAAEVVRRAPAPLLAGWSDRGPPVGPALAAA